MALPHELQDLLEFLNERDPFELNRINLSPHLLVEFSIKWLESAAEQAEKNPRLVNFPDETGRKLCVLAEKFWALKNETPPK